TIGIVRGSAMREAKPAPPPVAAAPPPAVSPPPVAAAIAAAPPVSPAPVAVAIAPEPPPAPAPPPVTQRKKARAVRASVRPVATGDAEPLLRPAEEQLAQARIAEACALGRIAADAAPEAPAVWEFLGRCYMRLAEPDQAVACYRKYLALAPDGPRARFIRAIVERGAP